MSQTLLYMDDLRLLGTGRHGVYAMVYYFIAQTAAVLYRFCKDLFLAVLRYKASSYTTKGQIDKEW